MRHTFSGRPACRTALQLVKANVLSPKESKARAGDSSGHGLPDAEVNCHVRQGDVRFGKPMSLDIAWKHFKVAVEYDGDHHRTDSTNGAGIAKNETGFGNWDGRSSS